MASVISCPACGKRNRVPDAASGTPVCATCRSPLPWIVDADATSYDGAVDARVPVLVDLWAPWCGPCRMVSPVVEEVARERAGRLKVVKVDVDRAPDISARYRVQGIPTLLLLEHGREVGRQVGAVSRAGLERWIDASVTAR
jgi:thioredoxin 2